MFIAGSPDTGAQVRGTTPTEGAGGPDAGGPDARLKLRPCWGRRRPRLAPGPSRRPLGGDGDGVGGDEPSLHPLDGVLTDTFGPGVPVHLIVSTTARRADERRRGPTTTFADAPLGQPDDGRHAAVAEGPHQDPSQEGGQQVAVRPASAKGLQRVGHRGGGCCCAFVGRTKTDLPATHTSREENFSYHS